MYKYCIDMVYETVHLLGSPQGPDFFSGVCWTAGVDSTTGSLRAAGICCVSRTGNDCCWVLVAAGVALVDAAAVAPVLVAAPAPAPAPAATSVVFSALPSSHTKLTLLTVW